MSLDTSSPPESASSPDKASSFVGGALVVVGALVALLLVLMIGAIAVTALIVDDGGSGEQVADTQLNITLTEFAIEGELTAPAGRVSLLISNEGAIEHNVAVRGTNTRSAMLGSGGSAVLDLGVLEPGTYELWCEVAGHDASGMNAELVITEAGEAPAADGHGGGEEMVTAEQMDQMMLDSMLAFLDPESKTGVNGNQPLEPEILADGTKHFTLTAAITPWEKEPGVFVDAWTYNGTVPGPEIRVDVGDKIQVTITNETPLGTDIHWHGISTPNDQDGVSPITQDPIRTGETYTYEFIAEKPAIGMYHAHLHSQVSVPNGMFAPFIIGETPIPRGQTISGIEIPADLEPALEMPMVLNDAGVIGLTLNGKSFPSTDAISINQGDWVVTHYYNEGLTDHPMHLHQMPQLVFAKDGIPLDHPYWADTINVAPGERYSVLFHAEKPGAWVWHCHILTHVEREEGMFGMVTAVVVNPAEDA